MAISLSSAESSLKRLELLTDLPHLPYNIREMPFTCFDLVFFNAMWSKQKKQD